MLEMFDTGESLRNIDQTNLNDSDYDWYKNGWKEMTMTLVEIQNAMSARLLREDTKDFDGVVLVTDAGASILSSRLRVSNVD